MSVLDADAAVIALASKIDLVYGPLVDAQEFPESVDVTLVEGAVGSMEDVHKIQKIRLHSNVLVALGDCAVTSNVPSMRNTIPVNQLLNRIYIEGADEGKVVPADGVPTLMKQARPLQDFVKVDVYIPGCPPPARTILAMLNDLLDARKPSANPKAKWG
jgi:NAD-reducing hydrogenase small subunit